VGTRGATCSTVQGTVLIQHTPGDSVVIKTHVTVADTQTHDFITRFTNQVHAKVKVIRENCRSLEFHSLKFLPENSCNCGNECCHGDHETLHILIEFLIVNLLKLHEQIISGRKGFGQVHHNFVGGECRGVPQPRM